MELNHLHVIVKGLRSLAEIEKQHPVLGAQLLSFVTRVRDCCAEAYRRLSEALAKVRAMPPHPSDEQLQAVLQVLADAPNSSWFKEVSGICSRLAALAEEFKTPLIEQIRYTSSFGENRKTFEADPSSFRFSAHYDIAPLLSLLEQHERELKDDMRGTVANLEAKLRATRGGGDVEAARAYATSVQEDISRSLDEIDKVYYQIAGGSNVNKIFSLEEEAEKALRRPERVLILNMCFVILILGFGAALLQFIRVYQFILLTGFSITATIVLNAFYLRSVDQLKEQTFLKLLELATLKFFAPLTRGHNQNVVG